MVRYLAIVIVPLALGCSNNAGNCSVTDNGDGTATISCPDGTKSVVHGGNGKSGDAGANGQSTLVRLDPEPPGKNCEYGGTAIKTGIDTNNDGVLQDSEVTSTSYVCAGAGSTAGTTIEGTYYIHNSFDVALLAGVTKITGDLDIDAPGLTGVTLPQLAEVDGTINVVDSPDLVTLDLSALTKANIQVGTTNGLGGALSALTTLNLPLLAGQVDTFAVYGTPKLTALSLPLMTGATSFVVSYNDTLTSISVPKLTTASTLSFIQDALLTTVSLPKLTSVDSFTVQLTALANLDWMSGVTTFGYGSIISNSVLTSISGLGAVTGIIVGLSVQANPLLTSVKGLGGITQATDTLAFYQNASLTTLAGLTNLTQADSLNAINNAGLTTIAAPALTTVTNLNIYGDDALASLDLGSLTHVTTYFSVNDNALLKQCLVDALLAQLVAPPTAPSVVGNTGVGTCP